MTKPRYQRILLKLSGEALAGQGGYGIQTCPGMARIAAELARGRSFPQEVADRGVDASDLSPDRLSLEVA